MDLNRAATFVRVVEAGSFTAAATALQLPTSSVSRSVSKLEAELGVTLLERTTRKVSLTDAGRAYFERARDAIAGLDEAGVLAVDAAREPHGIVRVAVPPDMGTHLALIVSAFVARYPRIHVDVTFTGRGADLVGDVVDIAIVIGKLDDSSLIVRKLGTTTQRLYAAPSYLERRGKPRSVSDLARHDAVLFHGSAGAGKWDLVGPGGKESVEVHGAVSGDHHSFVFESVVAGLGIGLLSTCFAEPAVEDGRLIAVLPKYGCLGAVQSLVHPSRHLPHRVGLLRDFLTAQLSLKCTAHGVMSADRAA